MNVLPSIHPIAFTTSWNMSGKEANPPPKAKRSIRSMSTASWNNFLFEK